MPLNIPPELVKLKALYEEREVKGFNVLLMGDPKTGKTCFAATAPGPVLLDMFDPGEVPAFATERMKQDQIFIDQSYQQDPAKLPKAFRLWERTFQERVNAKVFDSVGTYVIDSLTMMSQSLINEMLAHSKNREPGALTMSEWGVFGRTIHDYMRLVCNLPCHTIVTCHFEYDKDDVTSKILAALAVPTKLGKNTGILFDEVYVMQPQEGPKGPTYKVLTRPMGYLRAGSRLGGNKLETYEESDFKHILKKCGYPYEDKK